MDAEECKQQLIEFTQRLDPVLNPVGFVFEISESGAASIGPFAAGFYANGEKKIGLIYRSLAGLGAVIYEHGQVSVSHDNVMRHLGKSHASKLKYDKGKFLSYAKDGGDVLDALIYDIENFEMEFLTRSDERFGNGLKEISRVSNIIPDSRVMEGIIIGMVIGGAIGCIVQSLGWGILIGFIVGLVGGAYFDSRRVRRFEVK